jgi:hypothetical protein
VRSSTRTTRFGETPDRIQVKILRSDDILGKAVTDMDEAWADLEEDPTTQKKYLLVEVPANEGKGYTYLLRLTSIVASQPNECGAIGQIVAVKGAKKQLEIVTHPGDCDAILCQSDNDCPGESQYCLSFECQDGDVTCQCPAGAYCKNSEKCAADCTPQDNQCTDNFVCCYNICSAHCPEP